MREIKFRLWNSAGDASKYFYDRGIVMECLKQQVSGSYNHERDGSVFEQYTGLHDKNGREIYEGDIVKIKRTLSNGEYNHEGAYEVAFGPLCGIELRFINLIDNGDNLNQCPDSVLCERYGNLDLRRDEAGNLVLTATDTWGENNMSRSRWKSSDMSQDFELIGNIHEAQWLQE